MYIKEGIAYIKKEQSKMMGAKQVLLLHGRVDLGIMTTKKCLHIPESHRTRASQSDEV